MKKRDRVVGADGMRRLDRRRLLGLVSGTAVAVLGLTACGSSDDDDEAVEDVATRVAAQGAPDPLPTPDPNATPVEDTTGGAVSGAVGAGAGADDPAAAGGDTEAPGGEVVELSAPGIAWSVYEITISKAGTVSLFNDGSGGVHNFVVEGYNDDAPVDMPIGETVDWAVPADLAPGDYVYYCAVPGHRALMEGNITITA